jgi:hypothetical protein
MTDEEAAALLAECEAWDKCFAENAAIHAAGFAKYYADEDLRQSPSETEECFDPVRDGWVDKNGRP